MLAYGLGGILVLLAAWILAIATGWSWPYVILVQGLDWLKFNGWQSMALAVMLMLLGLLLFFRPRPEPEMAFTTSSRFGEVRVTQEAIQEIISQGALTVEGVRKVLATLRQREEGLEITVICQFVPEVVIPQTSEELQTKVKSDVEHYTGIKVAEVRVLVRSLETARPARVR